MLAVYFSYGATIFQSVGIEDSFITQIILGAINFGCTFIGIWVMGRFGRRWVRLRFLLFEVRTNSPDSNPAQPLIIGGVWQAAWLFVFASVGTAKNPETNETVGKVMIVSACLFIFSYASRYLPQSLRPENVAKLPSFQVLGHQVSGFSSVKLVRART